MGLPAGILTGSQVSDVWARQTSLRTASSQCHWKQQHQCCYGNRQGGEFSVIIQFSNGGAKFNAGKSLSLDGQESAVLGAIAGAHHVKTLAEAYGVSVILHTDHCAKVVALG